MTSIDRTIDDLLPTVRRIAVVGLSANPSRTSHQVARVLQEAGYQIVPVNPTADEVLGERSYPSLADVPGEVDLVDVFRRPEHLADVAEEAAAIGAPALWNQLGLTSEAAAATAADAGMVYVEDRCLKVEVLRRGARPAPAAAPASARSWRDGTRTQVMGILNLNADSFSDPRDAGTIDVEERVATALRMVDEGADIIDVGAQSAALAASVVDTMAQIDVLVPVVSALVARGIPVSVDTDQVPVVDAVLDAGAAIVNDFSGQPSAALVARVAASRADYVLTHNPVGLRARQQDPGFFDDVPGEVVASLQRDLGRLASWGLDADRVLLDPGVDAGKTPAQTLDLLRGRQRLRDGLEGPLLWAISRKDVLGVISGRTPGGRGAATTALLLAIDELPGSIVRVHDVAATVDALAVAAALRGELDLAPDAMLEDDLRRDA